MSQGLFRTFFMAGFECSTHRIRDGRRLDLVASTRHDAFADRDYARLRDVGIRVAREGLRWHLIGRRPDELDFTTLSPIVEAARKHGVQVVFDLCHYGWPDWLDLWGPGFADQFARLAREFVRFFRRFSDEPLFVTPVNEISFLSWAAGEEALFFPYSRRRGGELKKRLVAAAIRAIDAVWEEDPGARILHTDPVINVVPHPRRPQDAEAARAYTQAQFEAMDMMAGRVHPELGGAPRYLDLVGLNYYHDNQWYFGLGRKLQRTDSAYRPLRELLREWCDRYERPLVLAETGIEGSLRAAWLRWVGGEIAAAMDGGIDIQGICLYPILNHPGWTNDRHCHNGLWDYADDRGCRDRYEPLAKELRRQISIFGKRSEAARASGGAGEPCGLPPS
jgi:beta-glucosidase/6-phospho-beta-glucosidase/beta-galactosidase